MSPQRIGPTTCTTLPTSDRGRQHMQKKKKTREWSGVEKEDSGGGGGPNENEEGEEGRGFLG